MNHSKREFSVSRQTKRILLSAVAVLVIGASAGCGNRLKDLEGTYYGDLSVIENNSVTNHHVMTTISDRNWSGKTLQVEVKSRPTAQTPSQLVALVSLKKSGKNFVIESTLIPSVAGRGAIKVRDRGACAQEEPDNRSTPSLTMVCATNAVVSLFATNTSGSYRALLYMSKNGSAAPSANLPPGGRFTLTEIFKRVREDSYENRLSAEKLYQANEEVKRVRSHLIPSISAGSVVSAVFGGFGSAMGIAGVIGNFVPFIFPSNWFAFDAQKAFYQAEVQSYKSLIANQMNLAGDLYHGVIRDQLILGRLRGMRSRIEATRALIDTQVTLGMAPSTDLFEYDDLLDQNENAQSQFRHLIRAQYASLSKGIGLSPRDGIRSLVPQTLPDLADLHPIDSETLMAEATATSLELRQFLFLERAALKKKEAAFYSFLSPSGWIGFNAGIFHDVRIEKSKMREVGLLREQAERTIAEQIMNIASLHNRILEQNRILDRQIANRSRSLETLEERYRMGGVSILQLRSATEGLITLEAEKTDAESAMAVLLGKVDRLLMRGPYSGVLTMQVGH